MEIFDTDPLQQILFILLNVSSAASSAGVVAGILAIILLLVGSALTSAAEVAFFSLGPNQLHELRSGENKTDKTVLDLLDIPKRLLATILITNNFINVAIVVISTFVVNSLIDFEQVQYWVAFLVQV